MGKLILFQKFSFSGELETHDSLYSVSISLGGRSCDCLQMRANRGPRFLDYAWNVEFLTEAQGSLKIKFSFLLQINIKAITDHKWRAQGIFRKWEGHPSEEETLPPPQKPFMPPPHFCLQRYLLWPMFSLRGFKLHVNEIIQHVLFTSSSTL